MEPDRHANEAARVAPQVWQEFSPRDGEELAVRDDGLIEVTADTGLEGFDIDPDRPFGLYVSLMADRIQTIVMESRQQMVPSCRFTPPFIPSGPTWSTARPHGYARGLRALSGT